MEGKSGIRPSFVCFVQRGWSIPYFFCFVKRQKCVIRGTISSPQNNHKMQTPGHL